ncbi:hypothetical protein [Weissella paramesenteroides]|uniref:hypothetical protein n=1 Tax=Weissella paramesenteroides TaxID=1249 RepID=UPI003890C948
MVDKFEVETISNQDYLELLSNELAESFDIDLASLNNALITISDDNSVSVAQGVSKVVADQVTTQLDKAATSTEVVAKKGVQLFALFDNNGEVVTGTDGLVKAKGQGNFLRGMFKRDNQFSGHAKIKSADATKAVEQVKGKNAAIAKTAGASMQLASVVVGQYYMSEINQKLTVMSDDIHSLRRSQQTSILAQLGTMRESLQILADNQSELLADEKIRNNNLQKIDTIKTNLATINNQALLELAGILDKGVKDEQGFIKSVTDMDYWKQISIISTNVMIFASELELIFAKGSLSRKNVSNQVKITKDKNATITDRIDLFLTDAAQKFNLTTRSSSERLQRQQDKVAKFPVPGKLKNAAANTASFISERVDYGFNFGMSDKKLEAIVPAVERITNTETIDSILDQITFDMESETKLLVNEGQVYFVKK